MNESGECSIDVLNRGESSVVVGVSLDELILTLLRRPRWAERRMPIHGTIESGLYFLERRNDGFVVWLGDREGPMLEKAALYVVARADPVGVRLMFRWILTRRSRVYLLLTVLGTGVVLLLGFAAVLFGLAMESLFGSIFVFVATWGLMVIRWLTSRNSTGDVWSEFSEAISPLSVPQLRDASPYRS